MLKASAAVLMMFVKFLKGIKKCDGQPYDTIDTEEWYAECGAVAPHSSHKYRSV